jgi:oxygen-independent coproporphyrinogen-3 oxidase
LPTADEKLQLYQIGKGIFLDHGYHDIGMDHFALPSDTLHQASMNGYLHRNFMGYTTQHPNILIGLGVSSISSTSRSFSQNAKTIHEYYDHIKRNNLPAQKGYYLNDEDVRFGKYILDISCRGKTTIDEIDLKTVHDLCIQELKELADDGLISLSGREIQVTAKGKNFIRNICSALDLYLQKGKANISKRIFSNSI